MSVNSFAELKALKDKIGFLCGSTEACIQEFSNILHKYSFTGVEGLQNLIGKINQANFKVIVIGKFSTGKSSLINTLLGEFVLPDSLSPCTAYINEIVYGEEKQATIYFKQPLPEQWADFVQNESVKEHIQKHLGEAIPPFVIPLEDLADCVTIPWDDEDEDVFENNTDLDISPFEKAVIQYPCELCRNGIEIIDSPGLDEAKDRTEIVDKYLKKVDAVIYVMTNIATGGDSDKEIIEKYLTQNDIKNVFFVCNLFGIPLKMARKQLFGRLKKVFGNKTLLGEQGIHLVNIRDMQNTGVAAFESALANYLNNEKGKAQLTSYIEQLTKLNIALKTEAAAFECVNDVELKRVNAEIDALKALIAADQALIAETEATMAHMRAAIDEYCKRESMERLKKISYAIRADIRDRNNKATELTNTAGEVEAKALAITLAQEFTERFEADYKEYLFKELTVELTKELEAYTAKLQKTVDCFKANMTAEALERNSLKLLTPLAGTIAQGFEGALSVDLSNLVTYKALNLAALLDDIVKAVFIFYASYQNENRGAKLTSEVQNRVSLDAYKKLERVKRPVVEYSIKEETLALERLVFAPINKAMAAELAQQQSNLAAKEAERLVILDNQAKEHAREAINLEKISASLKTLEELQSEVNA